MLPAVSTVAVISVDWPLVPSTVLACSETILEQSGSPEVGDRRRKRDCRDAASDFLSFALASKM